MAVERYVKDHGAHYVATTPLINMRKILQDYYGFEVDINPIKCSYEPPAYIILIKDELVAYKAITSY